MPSPELTSPRFEAKVDRSAGADGCHPWTASRNADGYGLFRLDGKVHRAHRVAWAFAFGEVPSGLHVLHACDNPRCVNPRHLFLGSHADNMKDRESKGRAPSTFRTARNPRRSKLGLEGVERVKTLSAAGFSTRLIAAALGVHHSTVWAVLSGRSWQ